MCLLISGGEAAADAEVAAEARPAASAASEPRLSEANPAAVVPDPDPDPDPAAVVEEPTVALAQPHAVQVPQW